MPCSNIISSASQLNTQHTCIRVHKGDSFSCKRFTSEPFWEKLQEFLSMWIVIQFALLASKSLRGVKYSPHALQRRYHNHKCQSSPWTWLGAGNVPNAIPHPTSFQPGTERQCRDHAASRCHHTNPLQVACSHHSHCSAWPPARQIDADSWRQICAW